MDDNSTSNMNISRSNCCIQLASAKIGLLKALDSPSLPRRVRHLLQRRRAELRKFYNTGNAIASGEANWANLFNRLWKANIHILLTTCACPNPSLCIGRILDYVDSPSGFTSIASDTVDSEEDSDSDKPEEEKKLRPSRMATRSSAKASSVSPAPGGSTSSSSEPPPLDAVDSKSLLVSLRSKGGAPKKKTSRRVLSGGGLRSGGHFQASEFREEEDDEPASAPEVPATIPDSFPPPVPSGTTDAQASFSSSLPLPGEGDDTSDPESGSDAGKGDSNSGSAPAEAAVPSRGASDAGITSS